MTIDDMTPAELEAMHVRVGRKLQEPPSFAETADEAVRAAESVDARTRLAEGSVGELIREQDAARAEPDPDGVDDDYMAELGLESSGDDVEDLSEAILEVRGLMGEASGDPDLVEQLSHQLDALQRRSATIALTAKMQEQELEKENDVFLADYNLEDV